MKEALFLALKGCLIGIANAIPGVSGGTIAVITGIYDRLIRAMSGFFKGGRGAWKANLVFLVPIVVGVGGGLLGSSFGIVWARDTIPFQTSLFFLGLILGSTPYVARLANRDGFKAVNLVPFVLAFAFLVVLAFVNRAPETPPVRELDLPRGAWFFMASILGMAAMVVPGISGSFVLLLFGAYSTFITAIKELNVPVLAILGAGSAIGLLGISRLLGLLLRRWHGLTYWAILGLVCGSMVDIAIRALAVDSREQSTDFLGVWSWPAAVAALVLGTVLALVFSASRKPSPSSTPSLHKES